MKYDREYTPEFITSLKDNEIFVFGSNIRGMHGGGAARAAWQKFDAEWGVGEGLTGKCYALPTMEGGLDYIQGKVNNFIACAKSHPELKFYEESHKKINDSIGCNLGTLRYLFLYKQPSGKNK